MWRLPFLLMLTTLTAAEDPVKTPEHKKWSALTRRVEVHVKEMSGRGLLAVCLHLQGVRHLKVQAEIQS